MADSEPTSMQPTTPPLRIACLIPSATAICVALGLGDQVVGVTHECDRTELSAFVHVLTGDGLQAKELTQKQVHEQVSRQAQGETCSLDKDKVPSLYPLLADEFNAAAPTLVFTQDLCMVCAPSTDSVKDILGKGASSKEPIIVSLTPESLQDVAESFCTVAEACGVPERGVALRDGFRRNLQDLQQTVQECRDLNHPPARMFLLEWLDPPFDGGHWIPDMMDYAGVASAMEKPASTKRKSVVMPWADVAKADADCVLVACCGFDLERNVRDTIKAREQLEPLRAVQEGRLYASNGDAFFANPGPNLLVGAIIMALCAYEDQPDVVNAIWKLSFVSKDINGWRKVNLQSDDTVDKNEPQVPDIEDFYGKHKEACEAGQMTYKDPATGYNVFTELAHKKRGKCCGSGCRHCPYSHENVVDKIAHIQQPSFLFVAEHDEGVFALKQGNIRVLFDSGGKDSFLTIRALVRQAKKEPFGLVLLTTFDATSRIIAHQDVSIDTVRRQAEHLGISLIGVPMHRGSSEGYVNRIRRALDAVEKKVESKVLALAFGDLHLDHILGWRQDQMGPLGYEMMYPLWKVGYPELLKDLEKSQVPCIVSSSTREGIVAGEIFNREFLDRIEKLNETVDLFGENGEFHSVAEVWRVDRAMALGL